MLQNLIEIFRIGELLPQKRFPINSDNRKLRNASNHIYRHIVKLFVGFLSHVLSTLIRRIVLNAQGIRSFIYSMDNMRAIRIHHEPCFLRERDGLSTDRICFQVSNSSECVRALLRTLSTLMHLHLNYILCRSCGMFNHQRMYSLLYQRPSKATLRPEIRWASFSISLLLRVAATASKPLSNAQIQGLFLLPSHIGMYKSTFRLL